MKTLLRNDRQLNKLSRREPNVASSESVCVVLGELPTTMPSSSIMTVFLAKKQNFAFYPYFLGLVFLPQVVHIPKLFNWLWFLHHRLILFHSNFFRVAAFLHMSFSGRSFIIFNFFNLQSSALYFSVGCLFYLISSFGYFLLIWFILFHPPTSLFSTFFLV